MWAIAINPNSGQGRSIAIGERVIKYFARKELEYRIFSALSADALQQNLESFLDHQSVEGIVSVGGDGLAHLILQVAVPRHIPFAIIPAGTGNDIVRTLGWSLDNIESQLDRVTSTKAEAIDLGNVDSEWFAAILSTGFDSIVNERANRLKWPNGPQRYNVAIARELPSSY